MEMRSLGKEGPAISVVGFGAWEAGGDWWGPNPSDDEVVRAMREGLDAGMNWIDTAEVYGSGRSEELVARAVEGRRDDVLLFTKIAPGGSGARPQDVRRAIRASLQRLRTDHVDLYQIHSPGRSVPVEETWGAMAEAQDEGLTRFIGVSNFSWDLVERCLAIRHVDSVQNRFSLIAQEDRKRLLARLRDAGVGYLAYSPLGLGILTGSITKDTTFAPDDARSGAQGPPPPQFRPGTFERILDRVDRLRPVAERLGTTVATLALRWVVEQDGVTAAIAGSRSPRHTRSNAEAGDLRLDDETLREIDEIFGS